MIRKISNCSTAFSGILFFWMALSVLWLPGAYGKDAETEPQTAPKILLISSFHLSHKWTMEVNNAITQELDKIPETPIVDYLELNAVRNRTSNFLGKFEPYRRMIRERKYDLIVAILDDAINLLIKNLDSIPKDQPIVFCGYQELTPEFARLHPNVTGVAVNFQVMRTIGLGLALMPDTQEIAVVTDDFPSGLLIHRRMLAEAVNFKRCKLTLINGAEYSTSKMLEAIRTMPEKSFVVFCPWRNYARDGYASLLNVGKDLEQTGRPYFVITDVLLGQGALGGCMSLGSTDGKAMADIIRRVLKNKRAGEVPFLYDNGEFAVDMAVMERFGLSEKSLPPETVMLNRRIPLWESHHDAVIVAGVAFFLLILLTAVLIFFTFRFRRMAADLFNRKRELEVTNVFLSRAGEIAGITYFKGNEAGEIRLLGGCLRNTDALEDNGKFEEWLIPEDRPFFLEEKEALVSGRKSRVEFICRSAASGEIRTSKLYATAYSRSENVYLGILQDITDAMKLENEKNDLIVKQNAYVENEKIINASLTQLVQDENFDHNIKHILKTLAKQLDSDRAYYGSYTPDGTGYEITHEWLNDGVSSLHEVRDPRFREQFHIWREQFRKNELLEIPDIRNSRFAEVLREPGCRTLLCAPVKVNRELRGIVGLGFIRHRRKISEFDENMIRSVAQIISLALQRDAKHRELELAISDREAIFRNISLPIMLFDQTGKLTRVNPAACAITHRNRTEILAESCCHTFCRQDREPPWCPVRKTLNTGKKNEIEIELHGREYVIKAEPVSDENGKLRNIIESAIDITEINESKRQLEKAVRAEQTANRTKSYFLASMSHEIRTPLNAVIGFSELLQGGGLSPEEQAEYLSSINLAGNSLLRLINDVLDLSKLEAEQTVLALQPTDPAALLHEIPAIFQYKVQEKNLFFRVECQENLPMLKLDNLRLRQILLNLVGNAVKFTERGGITIELEFLPDAGEKHGTLTIRVQDTGVGIPSEIQDKIFNPFVQSNVMRDTHIHGGTGLGLAISRRLAERMNGRITLESQIGKGSCFTLVLEKIEQEENIPA